MTEQSVQTLEPCERCQHERIEAGVCPGCGMHGPENCEDCGKLHMPAHLQYENTERAIVMAKIGSDKDGYVAVEEDLDIITDRTIRITAWSIHSEDESYIFLTPEELEDLVDQIQQTRAKWGEQAWRCMSQTVADMSSDTTP